jgi:hypothetical protein
MSDSKYGEPWTACKDGKCPCVQVWSEPDDHPIATFVRGDWGDKWPSIRLVEGEGVAPQAEAFMEQMIYGSVNSKRTEELMLRAIVCVNALAGYENPAAVREVVEALELVLPLAKGYRPYHQTPKARRTCDNWIAAADAALANLKGGSVS